MSKRLEEVKLGTEETDPIVGLTGRVTAKLERLHGGDQVLLETHDSTGRPIEHWAPVDRLE